MTPHDATPTTPMTLRRSLMVAAVTLLAVTLFGLLWLFLVAPAELKGFWWFLFSFASGLSMIVLPCTLPLAFVIVPLSMGRGAGKGFAMALAFGAGVVLMLSLYGVLAAALGATVLGFFEVPLEMVKNWVYFIAGAAALFFSLGEIGLLSVRMPSYTGAAPAFIQRRGDIIKAFFLGVFLGNIGVGCPHPATPLLLVEIASSGNVLYGWLLFLVHAIGRVVPLVFLAIIAILGVNGLRWIVARKETVQRVTGWAMVFVAGFILTLGFFTHDWWVNSGIHTTFERVTQEERFVGLLAERLGREAPHAHGFEEGTGLFGLPLSWGSTVLVLLWVVPMWWWWFKERKRLPQVVATPKTVVDLHYTRAYLFGLITLFLAVTFIYVLPRNFRMEAESAAGRERGAMIDHEEHEERAPYHEEGRVSAGLSVRSALPEEMIVAGATTTLEFLVTELPSNTPVDDLEIEHEKLMHVVGVRDDLSEFFHIHPELAATGRLRVAHQFREGGRYKLYSNVTRGGSTHSFGHPPFEVLGSRATSTPVIEFIRNVIVDGYQVALDYREPIRAGRSEEFTFTVRGPYGDGVVLEPYLAAPMHLVIVKSDLSVYFHTHPEDQPHARWPAPHSFGLMLPRVVHAHGTVVGEHEEPDSEPVTFEATFPQLGIYKLFAQFRPEKVELAEDRSLIAEFYVRVIEKEKGMGTAGSIRTLLQESFPTRLIVSLVLIVVLGVGVRRFVRVPRDAQ